jgi:hypothetical protein
MAPVFLSTFFEGRIIMNRNKTMTIAAAALSGLLAGSAARAAAVPGGTTGNIGTGCSMCFTMTIQD